MEPRFCFFYIKFCSFLAKSPIFWAVFYLFYYVVINFVATFALDFSGSLKNEQLKNFVCGRFFKFRVLEERQRPSLFCITGPFKPAMPIGGRGSDISCVRSV